MTAPVLVFAGVIIVTLLVFYVASRYKVANANEALIVAGSRGGSVRDERGQLLTAAGDKGVKVVVGGGTFVLPLVHRVGRLKLTARQINVQLADAVTSQGIKVQVQGVATFKIGRDVESLRNAAERFLEAKDEQVDSIVKNVLEGSLRSIVGTLTIEELIRDRQKLLQQVQDAAKGDLATSGLQIDAFTIQSFSDESNYIELLGRQNLATVERDARIAKANADQEAAVREAQATQVTINAQRDVSLKQAEIQSQVAAATAKAEQSGPLAQAEAQQEVVRKQTELANLEAERKAKELLSTTVRPAEADAEALVRTAEGQKKATIAAAEAQAEQVRLQGGAEAAVVLTKGEARAKALALRADAYKQFNEAAIIQTVLTALPNIIRAAAEPMASIDNLTVLSSEGASDLVRTGGRAVAESAAMIRGLTGLDVPGLVAGAMGRTAAAGAQPAANGNSGDGGEEGRVPASAIAATEALATAAEEGAAEAAAPVLAAADQTEEWVDDSAAWLAARLAALPEAERKAEVRLSDLESKGSAEAAKAWGAVKAPLADRFGGMTVREFLARRRV